MFFLNFFLIYFFSIRESVNYRFYNFHIRYVHCEVYTYHCTFNPIVSNQNVLRYSTTGIPGYPPGIYIPTIHTISIDIICVLCNIIEFWFSKYL